MKAVLLIFAIGVLGGIETGSIDPLTGGVVAIGLMAGMLFHEAVIKPIKKENDRQLGRASGR